MIYTKWPPPYFDSQSETLNVSEKCFRFTFMFHDQYVYRGGPVPIFKFTLEIILTLSDAVC